MQRAEKRALKYAKLYKEQRDAARKHASRYKMERDEALAAAAKAQKQCDEALAEEESPQASDAEDFLDWLMETEAEWDEGARREARTTRNYGDAAIFGL